MLDRLLIAGAALFVCGWAVVLASPGSRVGGIAVYLGVAALLAFAVASVARWVASRLTRA